MTALGHALVGFAIAALFPHNWPLLLLLALISHYVFDWVPHLEWSIKWRYRLKLLVFLSLIELFIAGLVLLTTCWLTQTLTIMTLFTAGIGAFAALFPDLINLIHMATQRHKWLNWLYNWHNKLHYKQPVPLSLRVIFTIEIVIGAILIRL